MLNIVKSLFCILLFVALSTIASAQNNKLISPRSICWTGERIFMADSGDGMVKEVDSEGRVIAVHGRGGSGKLYCGVDGIYISDEVFKRISYHPYSDMMSTKIYSFKRYLNFNTRIKECGNYICISGKDLDTQKTLHLYTKEFEYVKSIGDDLVFSNENPFIEKARHQLSLGEILIPDDGSIIIIRSAPLEIVEIKDPYDTAQFTKTERHDLVPKPWESEFITITEQSYRVGMYYRSHSASMDATGRSMLVIYDVDKKHTVYEFDYKTNYLRKTSVSVPVGSLFSNLVHHEGQSKYFIYDLQNEMLTQRSL